MKCNARSIRRSWTDCNYLDYAAILLIVSMPPFVGLYHTENRKDPPGSSEDKNALDMNSFWVPTADETLRGLGPVRGEIVHSDPSDPSDGLDPARAFATAPRFCANAARAWRPRPRLRNNEKSVRPDSVSTRKDPCLCAAVTDDVDRETIHHGQIIG